MVGKNVKGDNMEWSTQNTKAFIEIIYDRVKKKQLQGSTFKTTIWEDINTELTANTGENYGVERLKGNFNRLRIQHREFSALLARKGVRWELESNKVNAPEDVWEDLYTKGRFYKHFKKHGFEYNYDILGEIFNSSTTTGKLSQSSTKEPPTSNEERDLEECFLSKGVHIDLHIVDVEGDYSKETSKRKNTIESPSELRHKGAWSSILEKFEVALEKWTESMSARTEALKGKIERYKALASQATNPTSGPYSIDACMKVLDSMEDVSSTMYNNALAKFKDEDWRHMFILMPSFRKKDWLASLE